MKAAQNLLPWGAFLTSVLLAIHNLVAAGSIAAYVLLTAILIMLVGLSLSYFGVIDWAREIIMRRRVHEIAVYNYHRLRPIYDSCCIKLCDLMGTESARTIREAFRNYFNIEEGSACLEQLGLIGDWYNNGIEARRFNDLDELCFQSKSISVMLDRMQKCVFKCINYANKNPDQVGNLTEFCTRYNEAIVKFEEYFKEIAILDEDMVFYQMEFRRISHNPVGK